MVTNKELKSHYIKHSKTIKQRLKEFSVPKTKDELFIELCFCICTPQSKALKVAEIIHKDNLSKLLKFEQSKLAEFLKKNTRFHNNKAKHIVNARKHYNNIANLPKDSIQARDFIIKNIKGLGYKESSHFLRNIGYRNICIVDRHVITIMHELNVFDSDKTPSSPKKYLEMEQKIKDYAKSHGYDVDELDLALWSLRTGQVFK